MGPPPKHLDLFSGIGGFTIAAEAAGFRTVGFSETDPYASQVLKERWPHVPNFGDVRNLPAGIGPDLITGGFPCQPFSISGKRRGSADDRNLWPAMRHVVATERPRWVLAENVVGILSMEIETVLSDLENLEYSVGTLIIPACAVDGVHRRDRVWIIAGPVAHPHPGGHSPQGDGRQPCQTGGEGQADQPGGGGEAVSHPQRERLQGQPQARPTQKPADGSEERGDPVWWPAEPAVGRVAYGIPNRSHRLRGLGNAIVPQVAFEILREIRRMI